MEEGRIFAYNNLNKPASKTAIIASLEKSGLSGATVNVVMVEGDAPSEPEAPSTPGIRDQGLGNLGIRDQGLGISSGSNGNSATNIVGVKNDSDERKKESNGDASSNPYSLVPNPSNALVSNPSESTQTEETPEIEESEIDEFNKILTDTFGEGTTFREVK